ncbi:hypothetical protein LEP3755_34230 [Leptolyngbya sp. NIES-3755]|nr:hypothetical protein LEP3755_34230 [Leptolyngbya sp. NIES-3755]
MQIEYPLVTIHLKGQLGEEFGAVHQAHLQTPKDAIAFLSCNFPTFKQRLTELSEAGFNFKLTTPLRPEGVDEVELSQMGIIGSELTLELTLEQSGALGRVLLGVALVAAAVAIPFGAVGGGMTLGLLGGSLILGGVNQWLTPRPKKPEEKPRSTYFNQTTGVAALDAPIPVLLGELRTPAGAMPVLSSSLDTIRINN